MGSDDNRYNMEESVTLITTLPCMEYRSITVPRIMCQGMNTVLHRVEVATRCFIALPDTVAAPFTATFM